MIVQVKYFSIYNKHDYVSRVWLAVLKLLMYIWLSCTKQILCSFSALCCDLCELKISLVIEIMDSTGADVDDAER